MAAFVKCNQFVYNLGLKKIDLENDSFKIALTNTAMSAEDDGAYADFTDLTTAGGYTAGGNAAAGSWSRSGATSTFVNTDPTVWTATAAGIGPFQYAVLYDDTPAAGADKCIVGWWNYGSGVTLASGETFTVDLAATTLTIA
jgi:hypothetical protein